MRLHPCQAALTILGEVLVQGVVDGCRHTTKVHIAGGVKVAAAEAAAKVQGVHAEAQGQPQVEDLQGRSQKSWHRW